MASAAQRQGALRQSTERLREDVEKFTEKTPMLGGEPAAQLQAAGESMQGAQSELTDRNPGAAVTEEREALYRLSQAAQKIKEAKERISQGMMGKGMPMPMWMQMPEFSMREGRGGRFGSMLKNIELPAPEDFKAPREFRQDILDAMRAPSPRGFEEQNKQYYRRLVE
jgi:hypothetical protein